MRVDIEIRAGEGGDDAKSLVHEQSKIYLNYAVNNGLKTEVGVSDS